MKLDLHYVDQRLVALYDQANPAGADTDFCLKLAAEAGAQVVVDLGCGTGTLTRALATGARRVIGVDPSASMLAVARRHDPDRQVQWVQGTSKSLGTPNADLAVMTGNVAQVFIEDAEWAGALADLHTALRPGGWLAFESRNPVARGWEVWTPEATRSVTATAFGPVEEWLEVVAVTPHTISFKAYNVFQDTGETLVVDSELRFRSLGEIISSLENAGFTVQRLFGNWTPEPLVETSPVFIVVARRMG